MNACPKCGKRDACILVESGARGRIMFAVQCSCGQKGPACPSIGKAKAEWNDLGGHFRRAALEGRLR